MILGGLMFLLDPLLIKWLIDKVLPTRNLQLLLLAAVGFFIVYVTRLGFSALARILSFEAVQKLTLNVRLEILDRMNQLSADYHEDTAVGERLFRMEQDVDQVAELGSRIISSILQTFFNAVFVILTMCFLDLRLTCLLFPLMPIFLVFNKRFHTRLEEASEFAQKRSSRESTFLQEHLAFMIQVQLVCQERGQRATFLEIATDRLRALTARNFAEIRFSTSYMAVIALGAIAVLAFGGHEVWTGALTVGGLVAFYTYLARLFDPLYMALDLCAQFKRLAASVRRIREVVEANPSVEDKATAVALPLGLRGKVELEKVCFGYKDDAIILHDLDLTIHPGEKVALIGPNGSGKSTITRLIARLYDPTSGTIRVDGIDLRDVSLQSLRRNVSYVMQDAMLFERTLRDNVLFGNPAATDKDLREAIEIADLDTVVQRFRNGWDKNVGPKGDALSGGERQRVALARAILQRGSLLLLDEATAALDLPSEKRVFARLADYFRNQTIVFVTHRIATIKWVDRIVVLDEGRIREQGSHEQLLKRGQLYTYLWNLPPVETSSLCAPATEP